MQVYSKKKVENLVIDELVRQGLENKKEHFNMLKKIEKLMNTKKKPIYFITFTAANCRDGYETAKGLHSLLMKHNVNAILMPCFGVKNFEPQIIEIKE